MSSLNNVVLAGRRVVKAAYLRFLFCTGLLRWARARAAKLGVVAVTLHRVLPDEQYDPAELQPGMVVRASTFQRFLEYLARYCECVLPGDAAAGHGAAANRRPRVALTFDDGWKDNFETAFPISRKHGVLFTVFICPQMIDRRDGFWNAKIQNLWATAQRTGKLDVVQTLFGSQAGRSADALIQSLKHVDAKNREALIARLQAALEPHGDRTEAYAEQLLTWSDIQEMSKAGISFGSHTNTHAIVTDIPRGDALRELTESKSAIEAKISVCCTFAYPNGDWSPEVRDLVGEAGYRTAFINSPGIWQASGNQLSIPRINVWEGSLTGASGRFSRLALEYAIFWKAYRASGN